MTIETFSSILLLYLALGVAWGAGAKGLSLRATRKAERFDYLYLIYTVASLSYTLLASFQIELTGHSFVVYIALGVSWLLGKYLGRHLSPSREFSMHLPVLGAVILSAILYDVLTV